MGNRGVLRYIRSMTDPSPAPADAPPPPAQPSAGALVTRSALGGVLMGLANLVPGISGGTMLLAAGVYPRFIQAIAEVTRLRFKRDSLLVLSVVALAAGLSILLFAGPVKSLVVEHRWLMYSLFVGLTLGGIPVVWRLVGHPSPATWAGAAFGFLCMAALAYSQAASGGASAAREGFGMMLLAGVAGASAMILPGVSGGYLLLVLGVYVPILGAIDALKTGLKAGDPAQLLGPGLDVVLPVGLGVVAGVAVVSNGLKWLLERHEPPTLGALLGLLAGAVIGLWPFQRGVRPEVGQLLKGRALSAEDVAALNPEKWPTEVFTPSPTQIAGALAVILIGFFLTQLVAYLGRDKPKKA